MKERQLLCLAETCGGHCRRVVKDFLCLSVGVSAWNLHLASSTSTDACDSAGYLLETTTAATSSRLQLASGHSPAATETESWGSITPKRKEKTCGPSCHPLLTGIASRPHRSNGTLFMSLPISMTKLHSIADWDAVLQYNTRTDLTSERILLKCQ